MFTTSSAVQCNTQSGLCLTLSRPRPSGSSFAVLLRSACLFLLPPFFFLIFYPLPLQFTQSIRPAKSVYLEQSERGWATVKQEEELPDSGSCELTLIWMFVKLNICLLSAKSFSLSERRVKFHPWFFFKKRKCFCFFNVCYFDVLIFVLKQYSGANVGANLPPLWAISGLSYCWSSLKCC